MRFLLGVDEAGRGPLAGPVAVGVVMMPEGFDVAREFPGVNDSKKLSEKKREEIFEMLTARVARGDARFAVEFSDAVLIDEKGISAAVSDALARGVRNLVGFTKPHMKDEVHILLDGALRAPPEFSQETIIHGDALVPIISLASIAAKVSRDHLMVALAAEYPAYGFEIHKGYGTKRHYEMLREHGLSAIHRRTFVHLDGRLK